MKRFIVNIGLGVVAFMVMWFIAEYTMYHADICNKYSYKYNYVKGNPAIKTLLIGHSHFENSINPYMMGDSVFDFAISGRRWIYWDMKLAEQLFPTMPNLKTVIFPLGYRMPYESPHYIEHSVFGMDYNLYMYSRYMHCPYDVFPDNIKYQSALLSNRMGVKYWQSIEVDSLGYEKVEGMRDLWDEDFPINFYEGEIAAKCYQEFIEYFIQLAKVCYDNDIRFVVITCPCADLYLAKIREQGIKQLYDLIDSVAAHYPIEYYNYMDDAEFRADSLYFNCSHLNSSGADKFAIRVKNDLKL